jgi:uncharacterized protein YjbI with pentapeptide repeats
VDAGELYAQYEKGERDFRKVDLHGQSFSFQLTGVDLRGANLAEVNMERVVFSEVNLSQANLEGAIILESSLCNSNFSGANLHGSSINDVVCYNLNLRGANLSEICVISCSFIQCDLSDAKWTSATLADVHFLETNLTKSVWIRAYLSGVSFIESNLTQACLEEVEAAGIDIIDTIVPDGIVGDYLSSLTQPEVLDVPSQPISPAITVVLRSEVGADYTKLRDLLAARRWKAADYETSRVMLQVVGKEAMEFITEEEMQEFPCLDLRTIDQLWVQYSKGRFGFSVQNRIWQSVGARDDSASEAERCFYERVEWQQGGSRLTYTDMTFTELAPEGHLPLAGIGCGVFGWWQRERNWLFDRVNNCQL